MKKLISVIYFIIGIINMITSVIYFSSNNIGLGITYLCLAIAFISLGFFYKKKVE